MDSGSLILYLAPGPTNASLHRACEFSAEGFQRRYHLCLPEQVPLQPGVGKGKVDGGPRSTRRL